MKFLTEPIRGERDYSSLTAALKEQLSSASPKPMLVSGLCTGASYAFYDAVTDDAFAYSGKASLMLVADEPEGRRIASLLCSVGRRAVYFPQRELIFHNITASRDTEHERLSVLSQIQNDRADVVITTPDAALGYTISPEALSSRTVTLNVGDEIREDELSRRFADAGYSRVDMVEGTGQYSVRGDIVDI